MAAVDSNSRIVAKYSVGFALPEEEFEIWSKTALRGVLCSEFVSRHVSVFNYVNCYVSYTYEKWTPLVPPRAGFYRRTHSFSYFITYKIQNHVRGG